MKITLYHGLLFISIILLLLSTDEPEYLGVVDGFLEHKQNENNQHLIFIRDKYNHINIIEVDDERFYELKYRLYTVCIIYSNKIDIEQ